MLVHNFLSLVCTCIRGGSRIFEGGLILRAPIVGHAPYLFDLITDSQFRLGPPLHFLVASLATDCKDTVLQYVIEFKRAFRMVL